MPDLAAAAPPTKEAALLERIEARTRWGMVAAVALLAAGALTFAASSSGTARLLGGLAIFCAAGLAWSFARYRRLLTQARESLQRAPLDLLFERRFQLSKVEAFRARLWALDSEQPLAWFGSMQWSAPMLILDCLLTSASVEEARDSSRQRFEQAGLPF